MLDQHLGSPGKTKQSAAGFGRSMRPMFSSPSYNTKAIEADEFLDSAVS
jgi:hypothetical protein